MASTEPLTDLEDLVTCAVCLDPFQGRDPRSLPCLHSFCFSCIKLFHDKQIEQEPAATNNISCPMCKGTFDLPDGGIGSLQPYWHGNQIRDIIHRLKKDHSSCSVCKHSTAVTYCFTCSRTLCETCKSNHNEAPQIADHVLVPVDKVSIQLLVCGTHDELVEAFCTDCTTAVCNTCKFSTHLKHDIHEFSTDNLAGEYFDHDVHAKYQKMKNILHEIEAEEGAFRSHVQDVAKDIEIHKDIVMKQIEDQYDELQSVLRQQKDKTEGDLFDMRNNVEDSLVRLRKVADKKSTLTRPLTRAFDINVKNVKSIISTECNKVALPSCDLREVQEHSQHDYIPATTNIILGYFQPRKPNSELSKDFLSYLTTSLDIHKEKSKSLEIKDFPKEKDLGGSLKAPKTYQPKPLPPSFLSVTTEPDHVELLWKVVTQSEIQDLDILPNRDVVTVEGTRSPVFGFYNKDGMQSLPPFQDILAKPTGVATHKLTGAVAACSNSQNKFAVWIPCKDSYSSTVHKASDPVGITFTLEHDIVIGNESRMSQSFTAFHVNGEKIWEKQISKVHFCRYIAVDRRNYMLVSDQDNFRGMYGAGVRVYGPEPEHQLLFRFPSKEDKGMLQDPRGICTDSNNNILVADRKRQLVMMFKPDGCFHKVILKVEGRPRCIALLTDKYMVISTEQNELHMYEVDLTT